MDLGEDFEFNPYSMAVRTNPFPWYARLRELSRIYHHSSLDIWVLSRYDEVRTALQNPELYSSAHNVGYARLPSSVLVAQDPPAHCRIRALVAKEFNPLSVQRWEDDLKQTIEFTVKECFCQGTFEVMETLAYTLPLKTAACFLGIPDGLLDEFLGWGANLIQLANLTMQADDTGDLPFVLKLRHCFRDLLELRRSDPRPDLVSALARKLAEEEATEEECLELLILILWAGIETTPNFLGNLLHVLSSDPVLWSRLAENRDLCLSAVNECMRYDGAVHGLFRTTTQETTVRDTVIPKDSRIMLLYGSANRDPRNFGNPDRFDIERNPGDHLALGYGIHYCLGAHLVKRQSVILLETILDFTQGRGLFIQGDVVRRPTAMIRLLESLPLRAV